MSGPPADPERALALAYAPAAAREALGMLFRLDERLGDVVRTTSEPMLGQMRLTWWHEALSAPETAPRGEPLLDELRRIAPSDRATLARLVEGWEELLEPLPLDEGALEAFARSRGGGLFACAARLLRADAGGLERAGEGWALVDLAFNISDRETAERALAIARERLAARRRWPKALRPLGLLAALAARDARAGLGKPRRQGSPGRVARALWHGVTGR